MQDSEDPLSNRCGAISTGFLSIDILNLSATPTLPIFSASLTPSQVTEPGASAESQNCRIVRPFAATDRTSRLLRSHIEHLEKWQVIEEIELTRISSASNLFGKLSRAVYDARPQNALIDWCSVSEHGRFRILSPFYQVLVGLGIGASRPAIAELDLTSFFFQFRWSDELAAAHCFRTSESGRERAFRCVAPVQGSALMPLVAQVTTSLLAEAPSAFAGPWEWVRRGISIVYDNILISDEADLLEDRWTRLLARFAEANVKVGDTQPPGRRLTSCGLEYDVTDPEDRRWRLSPAWCRKAADWIATRYRSSRRQDREVLGGLAQWALGASLIPLAHMSSTLRGTAADEEVAFLLTLLRSSRWRNLRGTPTAVVPEDAVVVVTDGSVTGAGFVHSGRAHAIPWRSRRSMVEQQQAELTAAFLGIEHASKSLRPGTAILLVTDNTGVIAGLASGNPRSARGVSVVRKLYDEVLRGPLWLAHVPSADNVADAPSRSLSLGVTPSGWRQSLEQEWRSSAVLARWSMAVPYLPE